MLIGPSRRSDNSTLPWRPIPASIASVNPTQNLRRRKARHQSARPHQAGMISGAGFTIIEVMIAIAILAAGIGVIMDNWASLNQARREAEETATINKLVETVTNRFLGALGGEIGKTSAPSLAWTEARLMPVDLSNIGSYLGRSEDELIDFGILSQQTYVENLMLYIEYYRSVDVTQNGIPHPGLLGNDDEDLTNDANSPSANEGEIRNIFNQPLIRSNYRLTVDGNKGLAGLVEDGTIGRYDSVIIRVVVVWGTKVLPTSLPERKIECLLSRRPYQDIDS